MGLFAGLLFDWAFAWGGNGQIWRDPTDLSLTIFAEQFLGDKKGGNGKNKDCIWLIQMHPEVFFIYVQTHIWNTNLLHRYICNIIGRKRQLIHFHWWGCPLFIFAFKWWQPNEAVLKDWYDHIVSQKPKCVFGTDFLYSRILPKQLHVKMNYSTCQNHQRILFWWKSIEGNTNTDILKLVYRRHICVKMAQIDSSGH